MMTDLKKILKIEFLLIFLIVFGVFFRFYQLDTVLLGDEVIYGISAMKFHQESFTAGKDYVLEHPPLGKWLVGLPSKFIDADYSSLKLLGKDLFVWSYMAYDPLMKNFEAIRTMEAIGGVISVILIFLISRKLFGFRAALWSTLLASLSFEMIGYSRIIYMETPMIMFVLLTLFLYINYLKSAGKKRTMFLGLFVTSLICTLLTRQIQPLFLIPIFTVAQFYINRNLKENIYFLLFLGISYFMVFHVIFPFDILSYGPGRYGESSVFSLVSFKTFSVIAHTLFRNSLIFTASLIALAYVAFKSGKKIKEEIHPTILIFFALSFLIFSFLSFPLPRHYIFMFLPLFIAGGYALNKISENKIVAAGLVLLVLINIVQLFQFSPNFLTYTNFGVDSFQVLSSESSQDVSKGLNTATNSNSSRIMSNDMNTLIFFNGEKLPITPALEETCNNQTINSMDVRDLTIVYVKHSNTFNFMTDPYVCPLLKEKLAASNAILIEI